MKISIKVGNGESTRPDSLHVTACALEMKGWVLHRQKERHFKSICVEHDWEFYAVLQFTQWTRINGGYVWWFKDVAGKDGYRWPMRDRAVHDILLNVEPQGVGLFDGKWRIKKHGGYLSVEPVLLTKET